MSLDELVELMQSPEKQLEARKAYLARPGHAHVILDHCIVDDIDEGVPFDGLVVELRGQRLYATVEGGKRVLRIKP